MTDEQLQAVKELEGIGSIGEAAEAAGMHRTTLERRLLVDHQIVLEPVTTFRLTPLEEFNTRQAAPRSLARKRRNKTGYVKRQQQRVTAAKA